MFKTRTSPAVCVLFSICCCLSGVFWASLVAAQSEPLESWRTGVVIRPVSQPSGRHTIHSYYLTSPESPDGTSVLFFASMQLEGELGNLVVQDRATGQQRVVAENIHTEDAHRAACQQWADEGKRVAFHQHREGKWSVCLVDPSTSQIETVAHDRQLGFGQPQGHLLPLYGCHWNPGEHRDLELFDTRTGTLSVVVTMNQVASRYGDWLSREFGGKPASIFFPVISPDQRRAFFKIAAGSGGNDFRSKNASQRQGLVACDLDSRKLIYVREKWGHPAWHPDSRHVLEMGNLLLDVENQEQIRRIGDLPTLGGCHPSVSPDGKLFVMDGLLGELGDRPDQWGVVVCDLQGGRERYQVLHRFDNRGGARTWRKNHPHPVFSADGRRIYFNVNEGDWTTLYVAKASGSAE